MAPFDRIIPARRTPRNYLLLILAVTLVTLAYFLFPQVRSVFTAAASAGKSARSILHWILLGVAALMFLLFAVVKLVSMVLLARLHREKLRRGLSGSTLEVPTDAPPSRRSRDGASLGEVSDR